MILVWLSLRALGYNWGIGPAGNTGNYHIEVIPFPDDWEAEIDAGAAAWNAGPGEILRGADWHWVRDTDVLNGALSNYRDEVYLRDQDWFDSHNAGGFIAVTKTGAGDTDIAFNSDLSWCTGVPSGCDISIGQTAIHEFGHRLGFQHENDHIAVMNEFYPDGGDISGELILNEDDYVGLVDHKTGSSTGLDLMLSKFAHSSDASAVERWDVLSEDWESDGDKLWDKSVGDWIPAGDDSHPGQILAIIAGTSNATPLVEWRVVPEGESCFDSGTEYIVGTNTVTIASNLPYRIGPDAWDLSAVPAGRYTLCARIDPYDVYDDETSEVDNSLRSEADVVVQL